MLIRVTPASTRRAVEARVSRFGPEFDMEFHIPRILKPVVQHHHNTWHRTGTRLIVMAENRIGGVSAYVRDYTPSLDMGIPVLPVHGDDEKVNDIIMRLSRDFAVTMIQGGDRQGREALATSLLNAVSVKAQVVKWPRLVFIDIFEMKRPYVIAGCNTMA